jgi:acetyl-CoA carboxylase, biotin carboxylase subunit
MIKTLLVANRGEIARRVIRTAKALGIRTVAVCSEADQTAPFTQDADVFEVIGTAAVADSYLQVDRILAVAKRHGVDAIHPGYGLLSENAEFARSVEAAGMAFVGPSPETIELMGSKVEARSAAQKAGLAVVPGSPPVRNLAEGLAAAEAIGFPLLVKASAGGGGIGMTRVRKPAKLERALVDAMARGQRFFGDDTVFLERLVERPHHVEVQVLGDGKGGVIHFGDRECSIQRRHQKLLEEAPGPFLQTAARERLCAAAVALAASVNYRGAGTVEFIADAAGAFYFLEMNTRLQVEHTVTEMITGIDLVAAQLAVSNGEGLAWLQSDIEISGHAIEMRLCAEDPERRFAPGPGTLTRWNEPTGDGVRVDSGVVEGDEVTPFYDSLMAKLVVWGEDRSEAIARALTALDGFEIEGVPSTLAMHRQVLEHEVFASGLYDTGFLKEHLNLKG